MCVPLRIDEIEGLLPKHLISEFDEKTSEPTITGDAPLTGMTEWSAPWHSRQLSFGLDFYYYPVRRQLEGRWTTLRTNVIVIDETGVDQGEDCLRLCVARMMTRVNWEIEVVEALGIRPLHLSHQSRPFIAARTAALILLLASSLDTA